MFGMGFWELVVIAIVALLVLGPEKLPEAAKTLSKGIRDFRKQTRELQQSIESDEEIGGAIRDIKSALRGEELRPSVRARHHAGSRSGDVGAPTGAAAGAATGDQAPAETEADGQDLRATRDMRKPDQAAGGQPGAAGESAPDAAEATSPREVSPPETTDASALLRAAAGAVPRAEAAVIDSADTPGAGETADATSHGHGAEAASATSPGAAGSDDTPEGAAADHGHG